MRLYSKALRALALWACLGAALSAPALASSARAVEMGCYNCHAQPTRADAPSLERLAAKYAGRGAAAESHEVEELLQPNLLKRIPAHERLSPEAARELVHWLFQGAK